jgi:glycosyltransferase involved in cell wall biosynthesis
MHGKHAPLVSICIPTHNDATVVKDALSSAMGQSYSPLEIVVIDNHSSDDTWRIVTDAANSDERIRTFRNDENIGMAHNFSACVAAARGNFVLILCADDVLDPGCIGVLAEALRDHPDAVFAACGRNATDRSLEPQRVLRARTSTEKVDGDKLIRECFVHGNRIGEPSAVLFKRAPAHRGFNPEYSQALDLEMWFYLLGQGSAILVAEPLCFIRQHALQTTQANIASGRIVEDKRLLFRQYGGKVGSALSLWEKLLWDVRMASSSARTRVAGGAVEVSRIAEVFCRTSFVFFLAPLALILWKLGGIAGARQLLRQR